MFTYPNSNINIIHLPSAFSNTLGDLPSIIATQELVVPKSMPIIWPLTLPPALFDASLASLETISFNDD
jgi:hypothetical protein